MADQYVLDKLGDLLLIPVDRLSDCLRGLAENGAVTLDPFDSNNIDAIVTALQHRGDSRGGEAS